MAARVYDVSLLLADGSTKTVRREHGGESAQCVMRVRFRPVHAPGHRG